MPRCETFSIHGMMMTPSRRYWDAAWAPRNTNDAGNTFNDVIKRRPASSLTADAEANGDSAMEGERGLGRRRYRPIAALLGR